MRCAYENVPDAVCSRPLHPARPTPPAPPAPPVSGSGPRRRTYAALFAALRCPRPVGDARGGGGGGGGGQVGVARQLARETNAQLAGLIAQIVLFHLAGWRAELVEAQVCGPRLLDLDWRVDLATASDKSARMAAPTCIVQLQVQDAPRRKGELPGVSTQAFEMDKEQLSAMLDGLGRIRDQLSGVAQ